jgi:RsiW-degrading membrane proteinase PrsW (M82 family)
MKLRLTVESGSLIGQQCELRTGALLLGRNADCDLRFNPVVETIVSSRHAVIQNEPDGFYLIDQQSTNGTLVNGQRTTRIRLASDDVIELGAQGPRLRVALESDAPKPPLYPAQPTPPGAVHRPAVFGAAPTGSPQGFRHTVTNLGLYNPERKSATTGSPVKYVGIAVASVVTLLLSLIVIALVYLELGVVGAVIAGVVAFVPALFYVMPLLWLDRYDPEPPWALAGGFAWGALVAVLFSLAVNTLIGSIFGGTVGAVVSAPIFEEGSKGLGVVLVWLLLRREFDDIVDGIVYAGVIALGFATVENVFYYGRALVAEGPSALASIFILRGVLSPFAHVTFTAMTGIGCGLARESHNLAIRFLMPLLGYGGAVILHAIWNGVASFGGGPFLVWYVIFEVPFFLLFVGFLIYIARREINILQKMLSVEVAGGLITAQHLNIATSTFKRTAWIFSAVGGQKFFARRQYLRALSKLGLSYWHVERANAAQSQTRSLPQIPILRNEIIRLRDLV